MRVSALLALLPALAGLTSAAPTTSASPRKSLSFGPSHPHHSFESFPHTPVHVKRSFEEDPKRTAAQFIAHRLNVREGEGFFIRDDSYTDPRTLVTHVYATQLIDGLEVGDGNINVNLDRDGNVLSWGNSFYPGQHTKRSLTETARHRVCDDLVTKIAEHQDALDDVTPDSGPWGFAKQAAQVWFGEWIDINTGDEEAARRITNNMARVRDHYEAMCGHKPSKSGQYLTETEALASFLGRVSSNVVDPQDLHATPQHSLKPKHAPSEPPTMLISGKALTAADVRGTVPARVMYTQTEGEPRMVYKFEVEMADNWYEAYVDVETGDLVRVVDWAHDFSELEYKAKLRASSGDKQKPNEPPKAPKGKKYSYHVFPWGVNDPQEGKTKVEVRPWDSVASPFGWHEFPTTSNPWDHKFKGSTRDGNMTTVASTVGNNVVAHEDWEGRNNFLDNYRPVSKDFVFVYPYGEPDGAAPKKYIDMVVTQLFYTCNKYHDLLHRVGFDEVSGNFQMYNFDKGGRGGDPVIANAQDGSGYNNANFMTPPDGTAPRMRMYIWDTASPYRDGDLEAGIVIHEYSHGLSTRLTGGPANSGCLGWGEAGGMGEGWGDAIATIIRQVQEHENFENGSDVYPMGAWAANQADGIRKFVYTTNSTSNPSTYKTLDKPGYWGVHAIGEVWAEFLFVLNQRLIEKYGFSTTLFPPEDPSEPNDYYTKGSGALDARGRPTPLVPKHGNTLALQLIVSAMKLQPCRPSFFDSRDAIIQADKALTGGDNACMIWDAFAERGLGSDAEIVGQTPWGGGVRKDGYKVPPACK
ncbi:hypothetical protein CspHIS471_0210840 [Cutaneotrichosporon sp. HIS471]|nr:hypothetical protein CspHIS471_0210840 [Cutaneotrichosporon sp. HIS471]